MFRAIITGILPTVSIFPNFRLGFRVVALKSSLNNESETADMPDTLSPLSILYLRINVTFFVYRNSKLYGKIFIPRNLIQVSNRQVKT